MWYANKLTACLPCWYVCFTCFHHNFLQFHFQLCLVGSQNGYSYPGFLLIFFSLKYSEDNCGQLCPRYLVKIAFKTNPVFILLDFDARFVRVVYIKSPSGLIGLEECLKVLFPMTASMLDLVELLHQNQKSIPCHLNLSNLRTNNVRLSYF